MFARSLGLSVAFALALSACGGGSICKKWKNEFDSCEDDGLSSDTCEADVAGCDANDEDILDDALKCMKDAGLFECDFDTEDFEALAECGEGFEGLSAECNFNAPQT